MPARSLAIETATDTCSVALSLDGTPVSTASLFSPRRHAEELVPLIQSMLKHAGWETADLSYVAVSAGPGSYTGLRIGVSTAKGICFAVDAELVVVSTLEALAEQVRPCCAPGDLIAAIFDARRDRIYGALYRVEHDGTLRSELPPEATASAQFAARLNDVPGSIWMSGDGTRKVIEAGLERDLHVTEHPASAITVARIAHAQWLRGETEDLASYEPDYLREFVATKPSSNAFQKLPF